MVWSSVNARANHGSPRLASVSNGHNGSSPPAQPAPIVTKKYAQPFRATGDTLACLVGASMTVVGQSVLVFGGFHQYTDDVYNDLYQLTVHNGRYKWTNLLYIKGNRPSKRNDHSAALWQGNKLVIFGGSSDDEVYCNDVSVLDLTTMTWHQPEIHGQLPMGRMKHSSTIHNDKLYISGGKLSGSHFSDTIDILDLKKWVWLPSIPFVRRCQHITFFHRNRLYLYGGLAEKMDRSHNISFINFDTYQVTELQVNAPETPSLAGQHFAQVCGDDLVVVVTNPIKQVVSESTAGVWSLDLTSMTWRRRGGGARFDAGQWYYFAMAEHDTSFYLFGTSEEESEEYYSQVLKVDLQEHGIYAVPPPQMGSDLVQMLTSDAGRQLADFYIISGQDQTPPIHVHRLILLARWPHFENLIQSGMAESVSMHLRIPESYDVVHAFVTFLYADSIDQFDIDLVSDLLVIANIYLLPRLLALCARRMHAHMDIGNVSKIYHCAGVASQRGLQQTALNYMFEHYGDVSRTIGFRNLPKEVLLDFWDHTPSNAIITTKDMMQVDRIEGTEDTAPTNYPGGGEEEDDEDEEQDDDDEIVN
ncbi:hypothetical protein K450DRAFT_251329 [Umbelopsis ramanniana AG]|uniref:BTB domain-containing protein n=1 Tax=Umbelopsis ramanniana AG TaxID=1314678 RepID=A0AAD5E692_UMBRA|nr:uncharacterized protein K450DRAFT_251329 [Umbelopsis ramanniana AG]KAI8577539.1 hypothetical protein K450DRAFT_251329 [Umbelopsis ramanniana AG]